ncbi:kinase-like domain-containing protein [Rhizophagus clarus]|uniref:Kinase-like domain-containing protein n=1 Tax=Rhizophagus clarus TaxID=94130 RepID=A0A8H3MER3_9GLOM|nr:kinase-like domain-containing protein [Rhizophagus clarus]
MTSFGYCYEKEIGTSINEKKAVELYQNAANLGLGSSTDQYNPGLMYQNGVRITENINKAIYWFKKAAEQGNRDAQNN